MEKVFEVIKGYDIDIKKIEKNSDLIFRCEGRQSKVIFYLDMSWNETKIFKNYNGLDGAVLYLITIKDNIDEILTNMAHFNEKQGHILVYDPNEDIQFFSKDFWNLYITI